MLGSYFIGSLISQSLFRILCHECSVEAKNIYNDKKMMRELNIVLQKSNCNSSNIRIVGGGCANCKKSWLHQMRLLC